MLIKKIITCIIIDLNTIKLRNKKIDFMNFIKNCYYIQFKLRAIIKNLKK